MSKQPRPERDLGVALAWIFFLTVTAAMIYLFVEVAAEQTPPPAKGFSGQTVDRQLPMLEPYEGE